MNDAQVYGEPLCLPNVMLWVTIKLARLKFAARCFCTPTVEMVAPMLRSSSSWPSR